MYVEVHGWHLTFALKMGSVSKGDVVRKLWTSFAFLVLTLIFLPEALSRCAHYILQIICISPQTSEHFPSP